MGQGPLGPYEGAAQATACDRFSQVADARIWTVRRRRIPVAHDPPALQRRRQAIEGLIRVADAFLEKPRYRTSEAQSATV